MNLKLKEGFEINRISFDLVIGRHHLNDLNVQKSSEIPHPGVILDFPTEWSKQGWLNCSAEIVEQSHTKIQPCLQHGAWHPQGHILSIFLSFFALGWAISHSWTVLVKFHGENRTAPPEHSEERSTIYALQLVKKNMPFLYHLLWYSEISSKKLKTVTILRVHRNLIFSPCSKHKAISLQLWEDGLLNRMPQSILNHNCFSGSKNKNTHFDNAAVTPLYDRNKPQQLMSCQEIMWKEPNKPINSNFVVKQFRMYSLKWSTQK